MSLPHGSLCFPLLLSLPSALPRTPSFLPARCCSISVPSLSLRRLPSLTSLSCSSAPSAWIFLTCSKHLSRKLWGRELAGPRGVASCTVKSALCQSSSCRAGSRRGLRRRADLSGSPGTLPSAAPGPAALPSWGPDTHPSASWGSGQQVQPGVWMGL